MAKLISIETTRYSEFFRRLLCEYAESVTLEIGKDSYSSADVPRLLSEWCTNQEICGTRHFRLLRGDVELFGFHDHPRELWAATSELPFVEQLHSDAVVTYRVLG